MGDNPFVHSALVDKAMKLFLDKEYDYVATITNEYGTLNPELKRFPIGIRVQVFSLEILIEVSIDTLKIKLPRACYKLYN